MIIHLGKGGTDAPIEVPLSSENKNALNIVVALLTSMLLVVLQPSNSSYLSFLLVFRLSHSVCI